MLGWLNRVGPGSFVPHRFRAHARLFSGVLRAKVDFGMIMALRKETGLGMQMCREAVESAGNDIELARQKLAVLAESKGEAKLSKNGGVAAEGLVGLFENSAGRLCVVRLGCKTDFVAQSPPFAELAEAIANLYLNESASPNDQIDRLIKAKVGALQEPITIEESYVVEPKATSLIGKYLHGRAANGLGGIASIVEVEPGSTDRTKLQPLVDGLARHLAGMNPRSLDELLQQPYLFSSDGATVEEELRGRGDCRISSYLRVSAK